MAEPIAVVTGASGFLGRHLVRDLLARGRNVLALGRSERAPEDLGHSALAWQSLELCDLGGLALPEGATVFHLAAARSQRGAGVDELEAVNVEGTLELARAALRARTNRFVYVSTARIFGASTGEPVDEHSPIDERIALDAYARSRVRGYAGLHALQASGLPLVTLCPSVIYGPDEPSHPNAISRHLARIARGTPLSTGLGDGSKRRDLVYVADVVRALLAAERTEQLGWTAIIGGEAASQRELEALVCELLSLRKPAVVGLPVAATRMAARAIDRVLLQDPTAGYTASITTLDAEFRVRSLHAAAMLGHHPTPLRAGVWLTLNGHRGLCLNEQLKPFLQSPSDSDSDALAELAERAHRESGIAARALSEREGEPARAPHPRAQRARWNAVAAGLGDFRGAPSTTYYQRCEIALMQHAFGSLRGKRLLKLDLWNEAFNTRILHWARDQGAEAFGIDASSVVARRAFDNTEHEGALNLVQGDIRELPFASNSFDCLYTMGTIEHIDEYAQALAEIARVLKPGGRAVIGVPHLWDLGGRPLLVALLEAFDAYPYSPEKSFSARELREVIERAGLCALERTGILTLPGLVRMADLYCHTRGLPARSLMTKLVAPFEWLETRYRWPGRFGYLLTYIAQKP